MKVRWPAKRRVTSHRTVTEWNDERAFDKSLINASCCHYTSLRCRPKTTKLRLLNDRLGKCSLLGELARPQAEQCSRFCRGTAINSVLTAQREGKSGDTDTRLTWVLVYLLSVTKKSVMRLILTINQNEEEAAFSFSFSTQQMCLESGALSLTHTVDSDKGRTESPPAAASFKATTHKNVSGMISATCLSVW